MSGPSLGRPLVDRIKGSELHNLKELRPASAGRSEVRILFVFDPWRSAILRIGGDKSGQWTQWYAAAIPEAERLYGEYLEERRRGGGAVMATKKWKDIRPELVEGLGGEAVVAEARQRNQTYIDAKRLAERRTTIGLTQAEVAERMGITKSRVSQIERGEVSTVDVISRYVQAIGGQLQISAVFGNDLLILQSAGTSAA